MRSMHASVSARNPHTGADEARKVLVAPVHEEAVTWRVPTTDGGGIVTTTPTHRFWVQGAGWTKAQDPAPGDRLRGTAPGRLCEDVSPSCIVPVLLAPPRRARLLRRSRSFSPSCRSGSLGRRSWKVIQWVVLNTWSESAAVMVCSNVCRGRR